MNTEDISNNEETVITIPIINILIILTIILILILPSMLKLNKGLFIIGFIAAVLIMNLFLTFFKVLYYDNSWYTQQYQYNTSHIYNEALKDIVKDTKTDFYYYFDAAYHSVINSFTYVNIKDNTQYVFSSFYESIKFVLRPFGKGFKYIFYGEPKSKYIPKRKKYSYE